MLKVCPAPGSRCKYCWCREYLFFQTHAAKNEVSIDQTAKSMIASTFLVGQICSVIFLWVIMRNVAGRRAADWLVNTCYCLAAARCNLTNDNKHEITIEMLSVQATVHQPLPSTHLERLPVTRTDKLINKIGFAINTVQSQSQSPLGLDSGAHQIPTFISVCVCCNKYLISQKRHCDCGVVDKVNKLTFSWNIHQARLSRHKRCGVN